MGIQLITTYLIVFSAFAYVIYNFIKLFQNKKTSKCGGCTGGCSLKYELNKRGIKTVPHNKNSFTYIKK